MTWEVAAILLAGALWLAIIFGAMFGTYWRRKAEAAELERERAIESRNRWRVIAGRAINQGRGSAE